MTAALDGARERPLAAARVASSVPGRLRLRLPAGPELRDRLALAAETLGARADVIAVEPRWQTGSLVVHYDRAAADGLWKSLAELGLPRPAASATQVEAATATNQARGPVVKGLVRANELVARRTQGPDLRTLVPVGLAMLAVRQLVRGEQRLADAPWYVLAWYASETFQKFDGQRREE